MRITIQDLLRAMFAIAFLAACIAGQWRGDTHAPLRLALLVGALGIAAALVRYAREKSPRYLVALGILGFLFLASTWLLITDWP
jgi:peptidoglycan/LPS O-acetylase OafA/YrhL